MRRPSDPKALKVSAQQNSVNTLSAVHRPTRTSDDARLRAASGIAHIASRYEVHALAAPRLQRSLPSYDQMMLHLAEYLSDGRARLAHSDRPSMVRQRQAALGLARGSNRRPIG